MKPAVWIGALFVALVLGYIMYSSFSPQKYRCEVCMVYAGRRDCRTASASTREHALRTAITNACAELAASKAETNDCEATTPASVNWIQ